MKAKRGDRDPKGRFSKGNPGGPGRPPRVIETTYLETLQANLTQERWAEICCKVIELAEAGDLRAFDLLCRHSLPPPEQRLRIEQEAGNKDYLDFYDPVKLALMEEAGLVLKKWEEEKQRGHQDANQDA
jgi:hypothetical protein